MNNDNPKKVSFYTLGCKLNFAETSTISRLFTDAGYARVEFEEIADVVVINTCSVTQLADKKCRHVILKASRTSPEAIITVVGCYSQLKPEEISQISGVDLVLGTNDKFNIMEHLRELQETKGSSAIIHSCEIDQVTAFNPSFSLFDRTRSFLKVQDGCDYHCSYCTIPMARGTSRNNSIERTVAEAREISARGIKEVVLTGVNIGDFGRTTGETFFDLVKALDTVDGIDRFRISSIEPNLLTDEIIAFVATSQRFAPHFHIPLQSGSDTVLKLMSRRYLRDVFKNRIESIRKAMPHACIGADVIVGFPGETEEQFEDAYHFIEALEISYLHVFSYSERRNTKAVMFTDKVSPARKEERCRRLTALSDFKKNAFYVQHIGDLGKVLFEAQDAKGIMNGFTSNYIKVEIPFDNAFMNTAIDVKLTGLLPSGHMNCIITKV